MRIFVLAIALLSVVLQANSQEIVYTDASQFPLYGKVSDNTTERYVRLPDELKDVCRGPVWYLGQNSAGLFITFRSNSPSIHVKWDSMFNNSMNHMTDTGTRGLDLYVLHEGKWRFAGSGRPIGKETTCKVICNMDPQYREYMLYLSLYDGVSSLEIGVEQGYVVQMPSQERPSRERPVVMYGSSILQGGCASRPGMAHTNIISRRLDREVINLGFSGNALLDIEIAALMASVEDPGVFVLDYVPNASAEAIDEVGEQFFRVLRDAHPEVPVIFIEDPLFAHSVFDNAIKDEINRKNEAQKRLYQTLLAAGEDKLYYIAADGLLGDDGEGTVDGIHFTDLGMTRYVDCVLPVIIEALQNQ